MTNYKNISLFEGLNSLRFFAAFLVVMHHSETIRHKNGLPNLNGLGLFKDGGVAVTFFFVLSGFLITQKNKLLTFSILCNNAIGDGWKVRRAIERFLKKLKRKKKIIRFVKRKITKNNRDEKTITFKRWSRSLKRCLIYN